MSNATKQIAWQGWSGSLEGADNAEVILVSIGCAAELIRNQFSAVGLPAGWFGVLPVSGRQGCFAQPDFAVAKRVLIVRENYGDSDQDVSRAAAGSYAMAKAREVSEVCIGWGWDKKTWTRDSIEGILAKANPAPTREAKTRALPIGGNEAGLLIDYVPSGRNGSATLTVKLAGEVVAVEKLDLTKPKQRAAFVARLCDGREGIDAATVEAELLKLAADLAAKPEAPPDPSGMPELDVTAIIRPERFITPEVSGLAVPSMTTKDDKVQGRWLLYLRWPDGKRERLPMAPALDLPDGQRLWIHPTPNEPTPTMKPGWSKAARKRWLEGEPAPDPAEVFKAMAAMFARFIDLPAAHASGVTATAVCWAMLTYVYQTWDAVPYLYIGGPLGSGKSRLFEVLARLAFRPLSSSNMTGAALFRTLHSQGGCLLLDEAEKLRNTQDPATGEILSMLLAGYKRGGQATRLEPVGDTFKTVSFDVYGPKALACIAGLPTALASRAIPVTMFRSPPGSEKPRRRIDANPEGWQGLRDSLHALAMEHGPTWLELPSRTDVCPMMSGRDYELWQPLLAIGSWLEEHGARGLLGLLQKHALQVIDRGRDEAVPDADEALLRVLAEAVRFGERPTPHDILAKAVGAEPVIFKNWHPRTVTARLKSYGIPTPRKVGSRREFRDVTPDVLRRIQESYGIDLDIPSDENNTPTDPGRPSQPSLPSQDARFPEE
jgi:hypothetical protein